MQELKNPSDDELRALYAAAVDFRKAKIWEKLYDSGVYCVVDPETKTKGYCSVLGMNREFFGICVYIGDDGMALLDSILNDETDSDEMYMSQDTLLCSFEDREDLSARDRSEIKRLGLSFRGRNEWPIFRRYIPGYVGWYLSDWECRFLTCILQQSLIVFKEHISEKKVIDTTGSRLLTRSGKEKDGEITWRSRESDFMIRSYEYGKLEFPDKELIDDIKNLKSKNDSVFIVDCRYINMPIQENKNKRPYFPKMFIVLDQNKDMIVEYYIISDMDEEISIILDRLITLFFEIGVPKEVKVASDRMEAILAELCEKTGIKLKKKRKLPAIDYLIDDLTSFTKRRG